MPSLTPTRRRIPLPSGVVIWLAVLLLIGTLTDRADAGAFDMRGAAPVRMSRAVSLAADLHSPFAGMVNPAAGSLSSTWAGGVAWSRSFGLRELDRFQIAAAGPLGPVHAGVWAAGFGRELYRERLGGAHAAVPLPGGILGGIGVSFAQIDLERYGSDQSVAADIGLLWPTRRVTVGATVQNAIATPLADYGNAVPARIARVAVDMPVTELYRLLAEVEWEETREPTLSFGADIAVHPALLLRVGIDPASERIHAGVRLTWSSWQVLAAGDHHPDLAWSQAYGLSWMAEPAHVSGP